MSKTKQNNSSYYPSLDNISYEETAYFLYGVDTDEKNSNTESGTLKTKKNE